MESPSIKTKHESTLEDLLARLSQCSFLDLSGDEVVSPFAIGWQGVDLDLSLLLLPFPHGFPSQHVHFNILVTKSETMCNYTEEKSVKDS